MEVPFPHGTAVDPPRPVHSPFLQRPATAWIASNELAFDTRSPLATGGEHDPLSRHLWPLFSTANPIDIVAETGLELLEEWVTQALHAGAQLRIVTGDYLAFNHVDALRLLLGWSHRHGACP